MSADQHKVDTFDYPAYVEHPGWFSFNITNLERTEQCQHPRQNDTDALWRPIQSQFGFVEWYLSCSNETAPVPQVVTFEIKHLSECIRWQIYRVYADVSNMKFDKITVNGKVVASRVEDDRALTDNEVNTL